MATNTYVALDTKTVGTAVSSVTFTSIPQGYTDLVLVFNGSTTATDNMLIEFNGDTATNYSNTFLSGNGSSASSSRFSNRSYIIANYFYSGSVINSISHIQNYSNTTTYKTLLMRDNDSSSSGNIMATAGIWRKTPEAINSIRLFWYASGTFTVGSTFTLYGIASADQVAKATGGMLFEDSSYTYHVFNASGTFTPKQALTTDILVVAGGGGGADNIGGGGGAGGLRGITSQALSSGVTYTVTVGSGGAGGPGGGGQSNGTKGENSSISGTGLTTITATGGGYGAIGDVDGGPGGSGGGTRATVGNGGAGNQGGTGEGYNGGKGATSTTAGGGGGASAIGQTAPNSTISGAGGTGSAAYSSWGLLTGTGHNYFGTVYYAGGGGGGGYPASSVTAGSGAPGGGGNGGSGTMPGTAGLIYSGGGGGGGSSASGTQYAGGKGGSGVVIIRYPK